MSQSTIMSMRVGDRVLELQLRPPLEIHEVVQFRLKARYCELESRTLEELRDKVIQLASQYGRSCKAKIKTASDQASRAA